MPAERARGAHDQVQQHAQSQLGCLLGRRGQRHRAVAHAACVAKSTAHRAEVGARCQQQPAAGQAPHRWQQVLGDGPARVELHAIETPGPLHHECRCWPLRDLELASQLMTER